METDRPSYTESLTSQEREKQTPEHAWLFDVDGVLTDPEAKAVVDERMFNEIIKRLKREPVGLNTGRSLSFIKDNVLTPLESRIEDKSLLRNLIAIGEKGVVSLTYDAQGTRHETIDPNTSIPENILEEIKTIVKKPEYADHMFYDTTKETMATIELLPGKTREEFRQPQQRIKEELTQLLNRHQVADTYRVDPTDIATDVENRHVGKALGARQFLRFLEKNNIEPQEFISFGDSASDYDMHEALEEAGKKSTFVFVGDKKLLPEREGEHIHYTQQPSDKGTLAYLQEN